MKTYRPWAPQQAYLLPPAPQDWLPKHHLAYFILDIAEDEEFGADSDGLDIPDELERRDTRLARIRQAKAELEEEARQARARRLRELADGNDKREVEAPTQRERRAAKTRAAQQREQADKLAKRDDDDEPPTNPTLPFHEPPVNPDGTPKPSAQRNFTDPDSKIMVEGSGAFAQAYNAQAAVTEKHQIIVACPLSNNAADARHLTPTLAEVEQNTGRLPSKTTADSGYWSAANAAHCESIGVDAYIATGRKGRGPPAARPSRPREKRWRRSSRPPKATTSTDAESSPPSPCSGKSRKPEASANSSFVASTTFGRNGRWSAPPTTCSSSSERRTHPHRR